MFRGGLGREEGTGHWALATGEDGEKTRLCRSGEIGVRD